MVTAGWVEVGEPVTICIACGGDQCWPGCSQMQGGVNVKFAQIQTISVEDEESWRSRLFLTIDIDWADDGILNDTIDLVEAAGVEATWFVTHETSVLSRLRENPLFELGIHPNFNCLLEGDPRQGRNSEEVVDRLLKVVPEAKSVRSHSMTQNSNLLGVFRRKGLTHDCNQFIPEQVGMHLKPWRLWNGLLRIPYFWEDDLFCLYGEGSSVAQLVEREGLKVFDFHPIHVFLNTEHMDRYERTRGLHSSPQELARYRCEHDGARTGLQQLLSFASDDLCGQKGFQAK